MIEGFVARTHSFSVHQQWGAPHQITSKAKATAGKGCWKPESIILMEERGTSRMDCHSGVTVISKNAVRNSPTVLLFKGRGMMETQGKAYFGT